MIISPVSLHKLRQASLLITSTGKKIKSPWSKRLCQEHSPWQSRYGGQHLPLPPANQIRSQMGMETTHTFSLLMHIYSLSCWLEEKKLAEGEGVEMERGGEEGMCAVLKNRSKRWSRENEGDLKTPLMRSLQRFNWTFWSKVLKPPH